MKNLLCKLKGHKLERIRTSFSLTEEYSCQCCQKKFTTDGYGRRVPMNSYWESNNAFFNERLSKKLT